MAELVAEGEDRGKETVAEGEILTGTQMSC